MIQLETEIATEKGSLLEEKIKRAITKRKGRVICRGFGKGRPVFLDKYLESSENRPDKNRRRRKFFSALELLRKVRPCDMTNQIREPTGELSFEFKGITPGGKLVGTHVREVVKGKNRKLYLISTF